MDLNANTIEAIVKKVISEMDAPAAADDLTIPVGISNRHIHLSAVDVETLFGKGYELQPMKELSQPGQFACKEQLTIIGPSMRAIEKVRVLGPVRKETQVEISRTDAFTLKIKAPVRESGKIDGSAALTIVGPKGVVNIDKGCIIANRHIHMSLADGERFGVKDNEYVDVEVEGAERRAKWYDVQVRVHKDFRLEMHVDTDDANAVGIANGGTVRVVKD